MRSPTALSLAVMFLVSGGCATLFGTKPSEHPVWSQPVVAETAPPAGPRPLGTLSLKLNNKMTLASLRGVAIKVDGRLVRRQLMTGAGSPNPGYETTLELDGQDHDVCVFAWFDGTDVLRNKELLVTGERLVQGNRESAVEMQVQMDPAPDRTWTQMVTASWTGGEPAALAPKKCGVDRAIVASPMEDGIPHGNGVVRPGDFGQGMLPPPPPF